MKAAIVTEAGKTPIYGDFLEPTPRNGESRITVTASALSHLTKGRASGKHYSSSGKYPFVAGVDGVGRLDDGRRVYFVLPEAPFGGMGERTLAQSSHCIELPDGLDDVTAAALANPGMSSWAALKERAKLSRGEVVLVNGATGVSGSLAIQIAKYMGAKKVIATGRNPDVLKSLVGLGADVAISLDQDEDALDEAFKEQFAGDGIDVVLDYLWGVSAEKLLTLGAKDGKEAAPIRFVQIGAMSGSNISLPGAVLRSSAIELMGSGIGSVSLDRLLSAVNGVFQAAKPGVFKLSFEAVPLARVEQAWTADTSARTVFTVGK
jgi:NADPH:quinone reductase-like Zn-dependent oxidoreductase